jgi:hypothetical protein
MFLRLLAVLSLASAVAGRAENFDVKSQYSKFEYRIPMRDGVKLFTSVYTPKDRSIQFPILLTRTPYGTDPYGGDAFPEHLGPSSEFARDKFIFVCQDVRGRYMSEGQFVDIRPVKDVLAGPTDTDETTDTFDTIDWLVKNVPNNNGKVGLIGTSYDGFYASSGIIRAHPALVAASPQAPMADLFMGDDAYHNGALFLIANFSFYAGFYEQNNPISSPPKDEFHYGTENGFQFYLQMGPLANSDTSYLHHKNPYWTDTYTHTTYDAFWKSRDILPHLTAITPAVLVVGGWYDAEDLSGTLKTFRAIGSQSPATINTLVMGPWSHGGWHQGNGEKLGDVSFGAPTTEFLRSLELSFFQHYLKSAPDPGLPKAIVFETGANVWKKLSQWPPPGTPQRLYFHAHGKLAFHPPAEQNAFDEYVSDPDNPAPAFASPTLTMNRSYMVADQRFVEKRKDMLRYVTEPLEQDSTVAGPISPDLQVSTTGTDSDFDVKLIDVSPDGYQQLVRGEPFRGKFRHSFERPEPFQPGVIEEIRFTMPDIYHCFRKGHRMMVEVQSSWFPLTDRNPQTFVDIPEAKPEQFVKATERVYRSRRAASFVEFNVENYFASRVTNSR